MQRPGRTHAAFFVLFEACWCWLSYMIRVPRQTMTPCFFSWTHNYSLIKRLYAIYSCVEEGVRVGRCLASRKVLGTPENALPTTTVVLVQHESLIWQVSCCSLPLLSNTASSPHRIAIFLFFLPILAGALSVHTNRFIMRPACLVNQPPRFFSPVRPSRFPSSAETPRPLVGGGAPRARPVQAPPGK